VLDEKQRKPALRMLTYGLHVLGAAHEGEAGAATVTWVTQGSFEPPLLVLGVKKDGYVYGLVRRSRKLALSLLLQDQLDVAKAFFKAPRLEEGRLAGRTFGTGVTGAPILDDAAAFLEGEVQSADETGDHAVVIARIVNAGVRREGAPLELRPTGMSYGG
jgi:flavin reductase (DIM6/NTAB) family NADH-FMN oxidoreductase RutF